MMMTALGTFNLSISNTTEQDGDKAADGRRLIAYVVFFAACVTLATFVIVSNVLFILACWKTKALRTIANMYVHSLAVADMTLGLAMYAQGSFYVSIERGGIRSMEFLCLTLMSTTSVGLTASFLSVMLIAIDRYIYIVLPYRYPRLVTARKTVAVIVLAWLVALLYGTVPMYNNQFSQERGCGPSESTDRHYATSRLVMFIVACSISGFCHVSIQSTAIRHIKKLYPTKYQLSGTQTYPNRSQQHVKNANKYMLASLKPIKSFFLVYVLFVHSWMPGLIVYTVGSSNKLLLHIFAIMAELSTGLNVLIYVFSNRQFKMAIRKVLRNSSYSRNSSAAAAFHVYGVSNEDRTRSTG